MSFKSIDTVSDPDKAVNFSVEFLNSLDLPRTPPHNYWVKIGWPIILLQNLNSSKLWNVTELIIRKIMTNFLESIILNGKFQGKVVLVQRIQTIPSNSSIPFICLQFLIHLEFTITIILTKSNNVHLWTRSRNLVLLTSQLYVVCSRVGKLSS